MAYGFIKGDRKERKLKKEEGKSERNSGSAE